MESTMESTMALMIWVGSLMYGVHKCLINVADSGVTFAWTPGDMDGDHQ